MKILKDTREQKGFDFNLHDVEVQVKTLKYGDYALDGNDDIIIERKYNTGELYLNLATKKEKERFFRECQNLMLYKEPIILCEFPESHLYEFPKFSGIPGHLWPKLRITGAYLRKMVYDIPNRFPPLRIVFNDNRTQAEEYIVNLFREKLDGRKKKLNF